MKKITQIVPPVIPPIPPLLRPRRSEIRNGCVNKPGCNSQIIYVLPYMQAA